MSIRAIETDAVSSTPASAPPSAAPLSAAPLNADEVALWRGFLAWTDSIKANVARDLAAGTDLSPADFEILIRLVEVPEHACEQGALTEALDWSASRISHQLSRMATRGYVTRHGVGVGRRMQVTLTDVGAAKISDSLAAHAAAVRTHFLQKLTPALADELGRDIAPGTSHS
jgi:DNA-binding MarR family transcriptional regulator